MTETRGRPARQDEVRQERRRRDDASLDGGQALKLAIPHHVAEQLAEQGRTPRWVNDVGNRMHQLTKLDDWDPVAGVEPVSVVVNKSTGETVKAVLCSKPTRFIEEDRAKRDVGRRSKEDAMLKGHVPGGNPLPSDVTYADTANKIERGTQSFT